VRIGYGRVSTRDQNPDGQQDALAAAGCEQVFIDQVSGKLASRPKLDEALRIARDGDQLVITKLDRLGRSLEHLIALSGQLQTRGVDLVVARNPSSPRDRPRSLRRCTTSSAPTGAARTPCSRSPTSSASHAQRSTATYNTAPAEQHRHAAYRLAFR
jgi:hypothetical protein